MKLIFVGDIHGRYNIVQRIFEKFPDHTIYFVGDFIDSYNRDEMEQIDSLKLVLEKIKEGKAYSLFGNHEVSYMYEKKRCSGWKYYKQTLFDTIKPEVMLNFKWFVFFKEYDILFTHAGITKQFWDKYGLTKDNLEKTLLSWTTFERSPFFDVGYCRGGNQEVGGPLWCDWIEEFEPVDGLIQVFGHTARVSMQDIYQKQGEGIRTVPEAFNIDCLDRSEEVLEFDTETRKFLFLDI